VRCDIIVSSFHDGALQNVTAKKGVVQKPIAVLDYNKNIGGVDRNDSQLGSYKITCERFHKYYQKLFSFLLDIVYVNAHIIFREKRRENVKAGFPADCD
jgi:hypothetical protein